MRTLQSEFAARLESGATTTCLCWKMTRTDGFMLAVTEHDSALTVDGVTYAPGGALSATVFIQSDALKPGQATAHGALSHDAITEEDLASGLWDGTQVDVLRVDWERPEFYTGVWHGRLSDVRHGAMGFEATLVSRKADFERPVGRVFTRRCDAVLGDVRCGIEAPNGAVCDQRFETCRDVFANSENFRGFPHMPGTDFVLAGPGATGNDGGKR